VQNSPLSHEWKCHPINGDVGYTPSRTDQDWLQTGGDGWHSLDRLCCGATGSWSSTDVSSSNVVWQMKVRDGLLVPAAHSHEWKCHPCGHC
jgi:hypothetical protein